MVSTVALWATIPVIDFSSISKGNLLLLTLSPPVPLFSFPKSQKEAVLVFEKVCFISVSGGKDSTLCLALALEKYRGTDTPVIPVFADTCWEHPATYQYLEQLEEFFGIKIHRVSGFKGGLPALIRKNTIFPSPRRRFCTQLLKTEPQRKFYEQFYFNFPFEVAEVWQGIRRDESVRRRNTEDFLLPAGERTRFGEVYPFHIYFLYPIKDLTERQVFEELRKRGIPLNPLYAQGFRRVGCYPCFLSKKDIIQVIMKALEGDVFSVVRLEEMKALDRDVQGRFNIDYSLKELIEKADKELKKAKKIAEAKARMLTLPFMEAVYE